MNNSYDSLTNMSFKLQMQNVGAEVARAIRFKECGKSARAEERARAVLTMLNVMLNDPKNRRLHVELEFLIEEFSDYMSGCVLYDVDPQRMLRQYDAFL